MHLPLNSRPCRPPWPGASDVRRTHRVLGPGLRVDGGGYLILDASDLLAVIKKAAVKAA